MLFQKVLYHDEKLRKHILNIRIFFKYLKSFSHARASCSNSTGTKHFQDILLVHSKIDGTAEKAERQKSTASLHENTA